MKDDKAQMMVLESVIFAITILVSLIFIYQLSPTSTVSNTYTNDLKIKADEALQNLYKNDISKEELPQNGTPLDFPTNKLIYYLITDDHQGLISSNLQNMIPSSTIYNIYISNGTKTILWCNSTLGSHTPLQLAEPVTISHYMISIHSEFLNETKFKDIHSHRCKIAQEFVDKGYQGSTYDVILEMSYI